MVKFKPVNPITGGISCRCCGRVEMKPPKDQQNSEPGLWWRDLMAQGWTGIAIQKPSRRSWYCCGDPRCKAIIQAEERLLGVY